MSTCRKYESKSLEQLLWMDGRGVEAFLSASFPFTGTWTGFVSGSAQALVHVLRRREPWGRVVSEHGEEAALFFLPDLESTSLNWHLNRWSRIRDQTTTANKKYLFFFFPLFVYKGTCLNRKLSETWLGLSLSWAFCFTRFTLLGLQDRDRVAECKKKKEEEEKKIF